MNVFLPPEASPPLWAGAAVIKDSAWRELGGMVSLFSGRNFGRSGIFSKPSINSFPQNLLVSPVDRHAAAVLSWPPRRVAPASNPADPTPVECTVHLLLLSELQPHLDLQEFFGRGQGEDSSARVAVRISQAQQGLSGVDR